MKEEKNDLSKFKNKMIEKLLVYLNGIMFGIVLGLLFSSCQKKEELLFVETGLVSANEISGNNIRSEKEEKICYLTFDDGPSKYTIEILDLLKEYEAKATFFVIGNALTGEYSEIIEKMVREGHSIGLHANDHVYTRFYEDENSWEKDWEQLYQRLEKEYGIQAKFFRFPGGSACYYMKGDVKEHIRKMHKKGLLCYDWNVSGEDAVGSPTAASVYENVMTGALQYNTPIVLLHDSSVSKVTVEALRDIMRDLSDRGYRFETLESRKEYIFRNSRP